MKIIFPRLVVVLGGVAMAACVLLSAVSSAQAASIARDPMVEGAMECTKYFPRYEREYAIPTHLLSAIASTESGRFHKKLKILLPWPWTVTSGGVGKYYDSKEEAIAAVKKLKASGTKNIDVGCMQVNLYHHSDAFANLEQAFDPAYNVNYAATFLRRLYNEDHSWKQAASDYHSKTPALGASYIGRVYDSWFSIIEKLRQARLAVPSSSLNAMNELKGGKVSKQPVVSAKVEPYPVVESKPVHTAPHMNSIKVSKTQTTDTTPDSLSYTRRSRDNGVLIVRPDNSAQAASSQPMVTTVAQPTAPITLADNSYAVASVNTVPVAAPVQSLALTQNGGQANASISVPLSGLTQAAVAPVTGLANAMMSEAVGSVSQTAQNTQAISGSQIPDSVPMNSFNQRRQLDTASVSYKSGPNFIFSE